MGVKWEVLDVYFVGCKILLKAIIFFQCLVKIRARQIMKMVLATSILALSLQKDLKTIGFRQFLEKDGILFLDFTVHWNHGLMDNGTLLMQN